ncbi:hypothetical protein [Flavobacterium sp. PL02]|uniref:hypothetical protein n=1 Tax=Flavobacterium sp. PL02 TaxID=3088354 RepID=UPI002B231812|nr:hypothetical protein [Flavobacterium sp. PL02]MEA9414462.1 hypothetical protein [Flavobacterium sp. PL02]
MPNALDRVYTGDPVPITVLEEVYEEKFVNTTIVKIEQLPIVKSGIIYGEGKDGRHVFNVVNQKGTIRYLDGQTEKAANINIYKSLKFLPIN